MGWSCRRDAGITLDALQNACFEQTKINNVFNTPNGKYMFEVGREQRDGAIVAKVWKYTSEDRIKPSGSLRIEPNGTISRGPSFLKNVPVLIVEINERTQFRIRFEGEPTNDGLRKFVDEWEAGYLPDGPNAHIGVTLVKSATVQNINGDVLATYTQPMFKVVEKAAS